MTEPFQSKNTPPLWWMIKVAATLLAVARPFWVIAAGGSLWPLPSFVPLFICQVLVLTGAGIHLWHYRLLKTGNASLALPDHLVTKGGLFPWVRHPMYLGDLILIIGFSGILPDVEGLAILLAGVVGLACQAQVEDAELNERFPNAFPPWRTRTRRLIPWVW
ncbi:hypothetical protein DSLASN_27520 [Desulfoluna limicola]|uniref:Isoprenylcysteine carboxyl methyltransferase n=1 Tax=Desulfoluna limicola TaxID=2810562 RepID=A0ABM7PHR2_9BACT|nr:methyltransferase [Desulfoluna limicola]BCS97120.1 hypothetical protein DSLASN_27520 [Desulfoluna limicola]